MSKSELDEADDIPGVTQTTVVPKKTRRVPAAGETADEASVAVVDAPTTEDAPRKARVAKEEVPAPKAAPKAPKVKKERALKKEAKKPLNEHEKFVRGVLKKAGLESLPKLETMFDKDTGNAMKKVKDIAIFIGRPSDTLLAELSGSVPGKNIINLSSEVTLNQVKSVAADVFHSRKFYHSIEVAKIKDAPEGVPSLQAESGRHRLALIGLMYGPDAEVPVRITNRTLSEARDSVVFANKTRSTTAVEKADLVILQAVNGDIDAKPDETYAKVVRTKTSAIDYAFHRVIHNNLYGGKLEFEVSTTAALGDCMTTATSIKGFLTKALSDSWDDSLTRLQFDLLTKNALKWLNLLVKEMVQIKEFDKRQHLAQHPLRAYGAMYHSLTLSAVATGKTPEECAAGLAQKAVSLGDIGREKVVKLSQKLAK